MVRFHFLSSLFLIVLVAGCMAPEKAPPVYSREVAQVGDFILKEDYLRFRLKRELDKYPEELFQRDGKPLTENPRFREIFKSVLDNIIREYMIKAYGQKKDIRIPAAELKRRVEEKQGEWHPKSFENYLVEKKISYSQWRQLMEDKITVQYIMDKELSDALTVSLAEIRDYYRDHRQEFTVSERVRVRHIVTDSLEKANDIHSRLLEGANFAKLAVNQSLSPDRARGGDLGYFSRGTYPKVFDEICFKLKKGEISPVVKSEYGYHIFKLLDKKPAGRKSLEEVATLIQQRLFEEKLKTRYENWIKEVRAQIPVRIHKRILNDFIL